MAPDATEPLLPPPDGPVASGSPGQQLPPAAPRVQLAQGPPQDAVTQPPQRVAATQADRLAATPAFVSAHQQSVPPPSGRTDEQPAQPLQQPTGPPRPPRVVPAPAAQLVGDASGSMAAGPNALAAGSNRRLLWSAKKGAKPIVALWLTSTDAGCELSSDIYPVKSLRVDPVRAGPYRFQSAEDAHAFAQEAARALMYLGCEVVVDERKSTEGTVPGAPAHGPAA